MEEKVYVVTASEPYGEGSVVSGVFKSKEKAEAFASQQEQLSDGMYTYFVQTHSFSDNKVNMNLVIKKYYVTEIYVEITEHLEPLGEILDGIHEENQVATLDRYYTVEGDEESKYVSLYSCVSRDDLVEFTKQVYKTIQDGAFVTEMKV